MKHKTQKHSVPRRFIILFLLSIVVLIRLFVIILPQREKFFSPGYAKEYVGLHNAYLNSQYVKKNNPGIIPDETFNAYAGGAFLYGMNPILIVHDHPPLGRYMLSLSILLFDNVNFPIIVCMMLSLLGLFLLTYELYGDLIIAVFPLLIFCFEPSFLNQFLYTPLLEPIQLPFIIFSFYGFIKALKSKNVIFWLSSTSIMIGFVISIRFFILGAVMVFVMFLELLLARQIKKIFIFALSLILSLAVLVASYTKTLLDGSSILHIFGIQKYIFFYHKSQLVSPLSFWDLLLFNRWHTWWAGNKIIHDSQWIILWPISILAATIYSLFILIKKISFVKGERVILFWILFYCILLSVGNTSTRYFLSFIPFSYIFLVRVSFLIAKKLFKQS